MHLAPPLRLGLVFRICHLGFCSEKKRSCNLPPKLVPPCLQSVSPAPVCPTLPPKRVSSTCLYNPPRTQTEGPRRVRGPSPRARGSAPRTRGPCGPAPRIHGPASRASWPAPRARGIARARSAGPRNSPRRPCGPAPRARGVRGQKHHVLYALQDVPHDHVEPPADVEFYFFPRAMYYEVTLGLEIILSKISLSRSFRFSLALIRPRDLVASYCFCCCVVFCSWLLVVPEPLAW